MNSSSPSNAPRSVAMRQSSMASEYVCHYNFAHGKDLMFANHPMSADDWRLFHNARGAPDYLRRIYHDISIFILALPENPLIQVLLIDIMDDSMMFVTPVGAEKVNLRAYFANMICVNRALHSWSNHPCLNLQNDTSESIKTQGRNRFKKSIASHLERGLKINFTLPAFPCKTSNANKAAVSVPDGAEYEALVTLHQFCEHLRKLYAPGCEILIVSDGHVFSDCTGVDDDVVTYYNARLKKMSQIVAREYSRSYHQTPIRFKGLYELLFPAQEMYDHILTNMKLRTGSIDSCIATEPYFDARFNCENVLPQVEHPVETKRSFESDICRRVLMECFAPNREFISDLTQTYPEHPVTALYRGFSRFMFDDLAHHPDHRNQTSSQRKKVAERVAKEMMLRNQAYSKLIEMILPRHIRLSIHAHDNSGPKFGIRLLPNATTCQNTTLQEIIERSKDDHKRDTTNHLHIPTPWHNSLLDIGNGRLIVGKAEVFRSAGYKYDRLHSRGGRFVDKGCSPNYGTFPELVVDEDAVRYASDIL